MTDPHENNFNLVRIVAASLVIVSHGIELPSRPLQRDFLHGITGHTLSWFAVGAFFAVSGYLISESWLRRPNLLLFARARALRILPGLLVMLCVTVPLVGIAFGTLPFREYITDPATLRYLAGNASIMMVQYDLPGVFQGNPLSAVNGSLWTLRYEVLCYAGVALLGLAGAMRQARTRRLVLIAVLGASVMLSVLIAIGPRPTGKALLLVELGRLTTCFVLGALFREFRENLALPVWGLFIVWGILPFAANTPLAASIGSIAAAYTAMFVAFVPQQGWLKPLRTGPDYSYGVYIYAFPIQQALVVFLPQAGAGTHILLGFLMTLPLAALSWHLVEKPALRWKVRTSPSVSSPLRADRS